MGTPSPARRKAAPPRLGPPTPRLGPPTPRLGSPGLGPLPPGLVPPGLGPSPKEAAGRGRFILRGLGDLSCLLLPVRCVLCGAALGFGGSASEGGPETGGPATGGPATDGPAGAGGPAGEGGPGSEPGTARERVRAGEGRAAGPLLPPICTDCAAALRPVPEPRCPACGKALVSERGLCMRCRKRSWSFDEASSLFAYEGKAAALVLAYKIGGRRSLAAFLAGLLAREIEARHPGRILVPVPPRPEKLRERGWDQVEELVRRLERLGFRAARLLARLPSAQQKRLGLEDRFENARAAYRLLPGAKAAGRLLLVDDVLTTGATAEACSLALREGGAESVAFVSLASD